MPQKIRELKALLRKAGFHMQTRKRKPHEVESRSQSKARYPVRKGRGRREALSGTGGRRGARRSAKDRMILPYSMVIQWSDEDEAYIVSLPEFGGCKTHGATYQEAV